MILTRTRTARWATLLLLLLAECSPPPLTHVLLETGFEQSPPVAGPLVLNMPPAVPSREQAHTGQWAAKLDQQRRNALLCGTTWQALGRPHHLRLRLWVWLPNGRQNAAILEASAQRASPVPGEPGTRLRVQSLALNEVVRHYQCWVPTTLFVTLPKDLQPADEVAVCVWGQNTAEQGSIYFDDITLENAD